MKLKLISDGIAMRTKVINAETGEPLEGIESISWEINAMDRTSRMTLTFEVDSEDIVQVFGIPRSPQRALKIDTQSVKEIPPDIALIGKPRKFKLEE